MTEMDEVLCRLGVTANYMGFIYTAYAVNLAIQQPERLLLVTKWLYPDVAKRYQTSRQAVERDIRTVCHLIWRRNRPLLEKLAGRRFEKKPRNAELLAILYARLQSASSEKEPPEAGMLGAEDGVFRSLCKWKQKCKRTPVSCKSARKRRAALQSAQITSTVSRPPPAPKAVLRRIRKLIIVHVCRCTFFILYGFSNDSL